MQDNNIVSGGKVKVNESKRGTEIHCWNFQVQRMTHVGTVQGSVYEKKTAILRNPEPSICMTQSEYGAVVDTGAQFLRCPIQSETYSISLADFSRLAKDHYNAFYGPQLRTPLSAFQSISKVSRRNPMIDAPAQEVDQPLIRQLGLFS